MDSRCSLLMTLLLSNGMPHSFLSSLSVTKWIHLNWGDSGMVRLFTRAYQELKPGGVFILESQPFSSYAKKRHVSHVSHDQITLKPESFISYLLDTIGFQSHQAIEPESLGSRFLSVPGRSALYMGKRNGIPWQNCSHARTHARTLFSCCCYRI